MSELAWFVLKEVCRLSVSSRGNQVNQGRGLLLLCLPFPPLTQTSVAPLEQVFLFCTLSVSDQMSVCLCFRPLIRSALILLLCFPPLTLCACVAPQSVPVIESG